MKRRKTYITLGIFLALTPLLSFPNFIETTLIVIMGLWVSFLAFFENRGNGSAVKKKAKTKVVLSVKKEIQDEESE